MKFLNSSPLAIVAAATAVVVATTPGGGVDAWLANPVNDGVKKMPKVIGDRPVVAKNIKKEKAVSKTRHRFHHITDPVLRDRPVAKASLSKDDYNNGHEGEGAPRRSGIVPAEDQEAAMELMQKGRLYRYDVSPGEESINLSFKNGALAQAGNGGKTKLLIYLVEE